MRNYIPRNLEECFAELKKILTKEQLEEFKTQKDHAVVHNHHLVLGLWIRDNWGLWDGSRLTKYFENIGVFYPIYMSCIILTSFHCHLNHKDIRPEEQMKHCQKYWSNIKAQYGKKAKL